MTEPLEVIYILGSGRCGSTLLDRKLGQLSGFTSVGELNRIWKTGMVLDKLCSCGKPFSKCTFWESVTSDALGDWTADYGEHLHTIRKRVVRFRRIPSLLRWHQNGFPRRGPIAEYTRATYRLYQSIARVSGTNYIIDSSKNCIFPFFLRNVAGLKLTVVHLVRDSRAVAFSWKKKKKRFPSGENEPGGMMPTYSLRKSSMDWTVSNYVGSWLGNLDDVNYMRIRYEDMVTDIDGIFGRFCEFVGCSPESEGSRTAPCCIFSGNPMRFESGGVTVRPDFEWKTSMGRLSQAAVTLMTLPGLLKFGYLSRAEAAQDSNGG